MEEKQLEDFLPDKNTSYIKKFNNSKTTTKINEKWGREGLGIVKTGGEYHN